MSENTQLVKVARLGGEVREFALRDGETAAEILRENSIQTEGYDVKVTGGKGMAQPLRHGDVISLVKTVRGG